MTNKIDWLFSLDLTNLNEVESVQISLGIYETVLCLFPVGHDTLIILY